MDEGVVLVPFKQLVGKLRVCIDCPRGSKTARWRIDKPTLDPPLGGPDKVYLCDEHFDEFLEEAQPMGMMVAS